LSTFEICLGIDFGTKRIGLAVSQNGLISPLPYLNSGPLLFLKISEIIQQYKIGKVYVGLSTGPLRRLQLDFVSKLSDMIKLSVETVDETATTIEAQAMLKANGHSKKSHRRLVDSVSAALILERVIC
jgi:putative transcription antitermination factor YqgF